MDESERRDLLLQAARADFREMVDSWREALATPSKLHDDRRALRRLIDLAPVLEETLDQLAKELPLKDLGLLRDSFQISGAGTPLLVPGHQLWVVLSGFARSHPGSVKAPILAELDAAREELAMNEMMRRAVDDLEDVHQARMVAEGAAHAAQQAAGETGRQVIGRKQQEVASEERRRYRSWLAAFVISLLVLLAIGWHSYMSSPESGIDPSSFARKALVAAPLAVFAGFAGRQTSHHRLEAQRHEDVAVRLKTASAFVEELDSPQRALVLLALGVSVYGSPNTLSGHRTEPDSDVLHLMQSLRRTDPE